MQLKYKLFLASYIPNKTWSDIFNCSFDFYWQYGEQRSTIIFWLTQNDPKALSGKHYTVDVVPIFWAHCQQGVGVMKNTRSIQMIDKEGTYLADFVT